MIGTQPTKHAGGRETIEIASRRNASLNWPMIIQGVFYVATGVWPLVSMRTFEHVTGPKTDKWLVKTAGVLVTSIGTALTVAGLRRSVAPEAKLLSAASAIGLTAIDVNYAAKRRIAPIYLLDAVAEMGLLAIGLIEEWKRVANNLVLDRTEVNYEKGTQEGAALRE